MGVRGLTSYVSQKEDLYLEDFQLKNCFLIIDGYSLASVLYNSSSKINSAFGGDYDKYAKVVQKSIEILKMCNVTPIVICDGGYEKKKVNTVKQRNLHRVFVFEKITPQSANQQCFPLMMRHVFRETLLNLNVTLLQSDFEADNEIAALAKKLDAPVLSNDSDFFIFDVQYIPLTSISFDSVKKIGKGQYCIPCQIFLVDKLLHGLGGLPKTMLPLLATILGNDYIRASQFNNFYSQLKMDKSKKTRIGQKRVKGLVSWLRNENFDSALHKVLQSVNRNIRKRVRRNIKSVMKGYTNLNTPLDNYLPSEITGRFQIKSELSEIIDEFNRLSCSYVDSDCNSSEAGEDDNIEYKNEASDQESNVENESNAEIDELSDCSNCTDEEGDSECGEIVNFSSQNSKRTSFPSWLLDESRKGNVCPAINTLLLLRIYFYVPQVEDYEYPFSGNGTLSILQTVAGLLNLDQFSYWARSKGRYVKAQIEAIKHCSKLTFPNLNELKDLSHLDRKMILLETLKVENELIPDCFPPDWELYIASIVYWVKTNESPMIKPWHIHALVITLITIYVISSKTGTFWQKNTFMARYGTKLKTLEKRVLPKEDTLEINSIFDAINQVSEDDCIIAMEILIQYFHLDERRGRHSRNFSRGTIHLYAQLQSTFELATSLNSLLLMPLKRSNLSMFYNGTFLFNFSANFKSRPNISAYVDNLFSKVPKIRTLYKTVFDKLYSLIPSAPKQKIKVRKNKQRNLRVKKETENNITDKSDNEEFLDSNNKFSLLLKKNDQS